MTPSHRPPFPPWLDRVRKRDARRWAKMTPQEMLDDIHARAQEALAWAVERSHTARPSRRRPRPSSG